VSDRSGLSDLDVAVLMAPAEIGARPDRPYVKSARVLDELYSKTGIPPLYGYDVMCNLAAPWLVNLRLLDPHGNYGSPDFSAAAPQYTEVRLSEVGMLAVAAERGGGPPVPIGLNGDVHVGGRNPPFNPAHVAETLARLVTDSNIDDDDIVRSVGAPEFPTGCTVDGDLDALVRGEPVTLTLFANLAHESTRARSGDRPVIVISRLPLKASASQIAWNLKERIEQRRWHVGHPELADEVRLPIADVRDETVGSLDGTRTRLVIVLKADADPQAVARQLLDVWGWASASTSTFASRCPPCYDSGWNSRPTAGRCSGSPRLRALV
jgi:DNA gyrase subunit A